jgi:hypothetical protein
MRLEQRNANSDWRTTNRMWRIPRGRSRPSRGATPQRYAPPRVASHSRDSRAIQSQASAIDLKSPTSSIVPSSHSASTYQRLSPAALISRGLKIGRGNLGMLVDMLAATRAGTVVAELADDVSGSATRHATCHAMTMIRVAHRRHPKASSIHKPRR